MEFNWSILVWLAIVIFVYIFGLYEGRGQGYKKRKAEEGLEKKDKPAPAPEIKTETVTVDDPGLLRIKNENGSFTLDLDGTRVNPLSLSSDQRRRLVDMLNIMRPWLEGRPATAASTKDSTTPIQPQSTAVADRLETFAGAPSQNRPAPLPCPSPNRLPPVHQPLQKRIAPRRRQTVL